MLVVLNVLHFVDVVSKTYVNSAANVIKLWMHAGGLRNTQEARNHTSDSFRA